MEIKDIENTIRSIIHTNHKLGEQTGGSGHLATLYADLLDLTTEDLEGGIIKVTFRYSISRESEFTVYTEEDDQNDEYEQRISIKNQQVIHIEPLIQVKYSMNPEDIILPELDDDYWFDRLDASYDKGYSEQDQLAAIAYFHSKDELSQKLLTPAESFDLKLFPKSMWGNHLKVLVKWIGREDVKNFFCRVVDDPNWPGFGFAWNSLKCSISSAIPIIESNISTNRNDSAHVALLEELKEETIQYEKHIRQLILAAVTDIFLKQNKEQEDVNISISQLKPDHSDGAFVYVAEFRLTSNTSDSKHPTTEILSFTIEDDHARLIGDES